jgi:hypothetical protein
VAIVFYGVLASDDLLRKEDSDDAEKDGAETSEGPKKREPEDGAYDAV